MISSCLTRIDSCLCSNTTAHTGNHSIILFLRAPSLLNYSETVDSLKEMEIAHSGEGRGVLVIGAKAMRILILTIAQQDRI